MKLSMTSKSDEEPGLSLHGSRIGGVIREGSYRSFMPSVALFRGESLGLKRAHALPRQWSKLMSKSGLKLHEDSTIHLPESGLATQLWKPSRTSRFYTTSSRWCHTKTKEMVTKDSFREKKHLLTSIFFPFFCSGLCSKCCNTLRLIFA